MEARGGYAVAGFPHLALCSSETVSGNDIANFLDKHAAVLSQPQLVLGGWRSPETDIAHLDVSIIVPSLERALQLARAHNQEAIWDFAACESIAINEAIDLP